jgi:hypothetical protein
LNAIACFLPSSRKKETAMYGEIKVKLLLPLPAKKICKNVKIFCENAEILLEKNHVIDYNFIIKNNGGFYGNTQVKTQR